MSTYNKVQNIDAVVLNFVSVAGAAGVFYTCPAGSFAVVVKRSGGVTVNHSVGGSTVGGGALYVSPYGGHPSANPGEYVLMPNDTLSSGAGATFDIVEFKNN